MENNCIGKRIKQYREEAGMSQEQLAEAIDVSVTTISNIERGFALTSIENFIRIANTIKASADQLLCDVIDASCDSKVAELSERWKRLSPEDKNRVTLIMETLLSEFQ